MAVEDISTFQVGGGGGGGGLTPPASKVCKMFMLSARKCSCGTLGYVAAASTGYCFEILDLLASVARSSTWQKGL